MNETTWSPNSISSNYMNDGTSNELLFLVSRAA